MSDNTRTATPAESRSTALADLVDRLTARAQSGEALDPTALAVEHPEFADDIRGLVPTLGLLGELSRSREPLRVESVSTIEGTLGDYRILREVGRGGMGVVYEAEQISLRRRVALKVLPFATVMDPRQIQRFTNEAVAAASLDHPHVVKVYGIGVERGVHFIAMQFIDGRTLADLIRARRDGPTDPDPAAAHAQEQERVNASTRTRAPGATSDEAKAPREPLRAGSRSRTPVNSAYADRIAQWGIQAAEALEHAHALGIVHRDVKPGNLLVDGRGDVHVADFGLAKTAADPGVTGTGDLLGTIRYMSPEQASAKHDLVDHRSDVYSLGVTLYELLALTPAFAGEDRQGVLSRILSDDPTAPRKLDRNIPRDLETIILKAMAKEPSRRYQSAGELAADLRRFLDRKPIRARRPGVTDRVAKWARRHRAAVAAALVAAAVGISALVASTVLTARAYESEARHRKAAEDALDREANRARQDALDREANLRIELYAIELRQVHEAWENGDLPRLRELLDRHRPRAGESDQRGFEWHYLDACARADDRVLSGHEFFLKSADISPDGRFVATADKGGVMKLWAAASGRELRSARYSEKELSCVRFSPDGQNLAIGGQDQTVRIWNVAAWSETVCIRGGHDGTVTSVAWSPDGKQLVSGGRDHAVKIWDAGEGSLILSLVGHTDAVKCVAWSPDGKVVASGGAESVVRLWSASTGKDRGTLSVKGGRDALSLAFNSNGLLAVGGYGAPVVVYKVWGRGVAYRLEALAPKTLWSATFDPSDRFLLAGSDQLEVWDVGSWHPYRVRAVPGDGIHRAVAFSRDGRTVLTAVEQGRTARVTDASALFGYSRRKYSEFWAIVSPEHGMGLCPESGAIALRRYPGGALVGRLADISPIMWSGVWSRTGHLMATATDDGRVQVWDTTTAQQTRELKGHATQVHFLSISPDGALVAGGDESSHAFVWRTDTGERVATLRGPDAKETRVQFSPDGALLAVANKDEIVLWDVPTWSRRGVLQSNQEVNALAFSPDSRTLAAGGKLRGALLWDVESGRRLAILGEQFGSHRGPTFSPDGRTLATIGADHSVRLWHVPTRRELFTLYRHHDQAFWVRFDSSQRLLVGVHPPNCETSVYAFPPLPDEPRPPGPAPAKGRGLTPSEPKTAP